MLVEEKIQLSSIEATAYWWVNMIKYKVRELAISGTRDNDEQEFATIFYNYTEIDWRKLYLELVKYISKDIESFIPKKSSDSFNQDTAINGHNILNDEISEIINQTVPNIRIASNADKDSVIYTTISSANVWYKSGGICRLSRLYEPSYILTGGKEELDFYNLLISTIAVLEEENRGFKSVSVLREGFCNEFMKLSKAGLIEKDVMGMFNNCFNQACEKGIILGRAFQKNYSVFFNDIDLVGLDSYMDLAYHYASIILQKMKEAAETPPYHLTLTKGKN